MEAMVVEVFFYQEWKRVLHMRKVFEVTGSVDRSRLRDIGGKLIEI